MGFIAKRFEENPYVIEVNLQHWFRFDHLNAHDGIALLVGVVPSKGLFSECLGGASDEDLIFGVSLLNGDEISVFPNSDDPEVPDDEWYSNEQRDECIDAARSCFRPYAIRHRRLMDYWQSGKHPEQTPLSYFVAWASLKGVSPKWKGTAIEMGLIDAVPASCDEKPLHPTERNTLLTLIAALCNYSDLDHQGRGASTQIARLTDDIGAHVDDGTVRKWLKMIPDALESRQK